jgi:8-oxo-dGTP pyrophosphatase MutT (NUDIX family)
MPKQKRPDECILKPELTVAAIIEREDRFLVVEELVRGRKVINQPAGHVEPGETPHAAVIRETLEETGWRFDPEAIIGIYLWDPPGRDQTFLRISFCGCCREWNADRRLDEGILRVLWLSREELLTRSPRLRSPMVMRSIDDYLLGIRYPCAMIQRLEPEQIAEHAALV